MLEDVDLNHVINEKNGEKIRDLVPRRLESLVSIL